MKSCIYTNNELLSLEIWQVYANSFMKFTLVAFFIILIVDIFKKSASFFFKNKDNSDNLDR